MIADSGRSGSGWMDDGEARTSQAGTLTSATAGAVGEREKSRLLSLGTMGDRGSIEWEAKQVTK